MRKLNRREFISRSVKAGAGLALWPYVSGCTRTQGGGRGTKKIVVLGIDGMDPFLLTQFIKEGAMPNFVRLIASGGFKKMRSSIPPQSPVAWSEFAVGAPAGVHGIFDFIHRDPRTMIPYLSTSKISGAQKTLGVAGWEIPLSAGTAENLREGKPFWEYLGEAGIPTAIFKMPGDFPVKSEKARCVSGMGTPDLLGSYGTFSFFTSNPPANSKEVTGGKVFPVTIEENKIFAELVGPINTMKKDRPRAKIPFVVWRDPENDIAKIRLQEHELIMNRGEWSDWLPVTFELVPYVKSVEGICKILVKQIHPHFEMYVSPINIDPMHQSLPVTSPENYGKELTDHVGLFGTKGLPADTKALSYGVLSEDEYLGSSKQILEESKKAFQYELERLRVQNSGALFFYFSNLDQDSHMYWRTIDAKSPLYTPVVAERYNTTIRNLYIEMDRVLGGVFKRFDLKDDNFRLIVMSDHGFAPFHRCVNLNTWLLENGFISLISRGSQEKGTFFENVNWSKTKAYGLGINAVYLNLAGRERYGTVRTTDYGRLLKNLMAELLALKDPLNGVNAISSVWSGREIYGRQDDKTPDLIIGWNRGYRASWETVLGGFPRKVIVDNDDKWSGDHCIDPFWVPAVLLSNKKITKHKLRLRDVTATVLSEFNIPIPSQMTGKPIYDI